MVNVLSHSDVGYVGVAAQAFSNLSMSRARETMEPEPFATKPSRRRVCQGDSFEDWDAEATLQILILPYPDDTLLYAAEYFTSVFAT